MWIGFELLIGAAAFAVIPWVNSLALMATALSFVGVAAGGLSSSQYLTDTYSTYH